MSVGTVDSNSESSVEVSKAAAEQALALMDQEGMNIDVGGLRLFVQQGGCAGLSYGMRFDNEPEPDDTVTVHHGPSCLCRPGKHELHRWESTRIRRRLASSRVPR